MTTPEQRAELRAELKRIDDNPYNADAKRLTLERYAWMLPGLLAEADELAECRQQAQHQVDVYQRQYGEAEAELTAAAAREAKLRELVAEWRLSNNDWQSGMAFRKCADELEALLGAKA